jgi:release factor glutamine methyltransferase
VSLLLRDRVEPSVPAIQPPAGPTVEALRRELRRLLAAAGVEPAGREASWLLGHLLGWREAEVLARGEQRPPREVVVAARELAARRATGEPFAHLVGRREFFGREFAVDARVLVPRPETELVVTAALALPLARRPWILDLGTGSGVLAVTLARELTEARVVASDLSPAALAVARANDRRQRAGVMLLAGDLGAALDLGRFDLVVSNPPYVALADAASLPRTVHDFEPALALFGGEDGLVVIDRLLAEAAALRPGAFLVLEVGAGQAATVRTRRADLFSPHAVLPDAAGIPRVVVLKRSERPVASTT